MRNLKLILEYDGSAYEGFQSQGAPDLHLTIQDVLSEAMRAVTGETPSVRVAGRTDAGVHALGQVVSWRTESALEPWVVVKALNAKLPPTMAVRRATEAPLDFDPRHQTLGKLYRYQILQSPTRRPLARHDHWWLRAPLDVEAMRQAAAILEGEHDFSSFRASGCASRHAVRILYSLTILPGEERLFIEVHASAFLKQMVRNLVGTLVDIGRGRWRPEEMRRILDAKNRQAASATAPAQGLMLVEVYYADDPPPAAILARMHPSTREMFEARRVVLSAKSTSSQSGNFSE